MKVLALLDAANVAEAIYKFIFLFLEHLKNIAIIYENNT